MTAAAKTSGAPVALPDTLDGLAALAAQIDWIYVTAAIMVEAGVDADAASRFFANFADGPSRMRVSDLAIHLARQHADWRPLAVKTTHYALWTYSLVLERHLGSDCALCGGYIEEAARLRRA